VKRARILIYSFVIGFILLLVLLFYIYRSFRIKHKANIIISQQNKIMEEKQKEIIDSITYAKRLQDAILPPLSLIKQTLPESFVLYKPKDIVAGDFYWMERVTSLNLSQGRDFERSQPGMPSPLGEGKDEVILIAAADCTGHGVPGAMVSVVCSNALNRTVKEFKIIEPGKILDKVRELVLETFEKSEDNVQDGMDISLAAISYQPTANSFSVQWSGANNPLWYIHNKTLTEVTADKQPIGKYYDHKSFSTQTLNLNKGDILYLFTDGYADQFGGPKGKKFKYRQLQETLIATSDLSMDKQKEKLDAVLNEWKNSLEQVDDVLIIGISL
jgi:serine phosphatase RsbU (regulator of sigma subunit)